MSNKIFTTRSNHKVVHSSLEFLTRSEEIQVRYQETFSTEDGVIFAAFDWRPDDSEKEWLWPDTISHI